MPSDHLVNVLLRAATLLMLLGEAADAGGRCEPEGVAVRLWGVDVHGDYQHDLSIAKLHAQGCTFVTPKVTEGTEREAGWAKLIFRAADRWIKETQDKGMLAGAYHWLHRGHGEDQAKHFLDRLDRITGRGAEGCLIQLDNEDDADWPTTVAWSDQFYADTQRHPYFMYTGSWWWNANWRGVTLTPYLWHSHYLWDENADMPLEGTVAQLVPKVPRGWWWPGYGGWSRATCLQFTSRGDAGGMVANIDLNLFDGTREQLVALTTAGGLLGDGVALGDNDISALIWRIEGLIGLRNQIDLHIEGRPPEQNKLADAIRGLEAAAAANVNRDQATVVAIQALADARGMAAGEILAAIERVQLNSQARFIEMANENEQLQANVAQLEAERDQLRQQLAAQGRKPDEPHPSE